MCIHDLFWPSDGSGNTRDWLIVGIHVILNAVWIEGNTPNNCNISFNDITWVWIPLIEHVQYQLIVRIETAFKFNRLMWYMSVITGIFLNRHHSTHYGPYLFPQDETICMQLRRTGMLFPTTPVHIEILCFHNTSLGYEWDAIT